MTFSQLYGFIKSHKQFVYNKSIPHTSCLWDTCKIIVLLAKGLNNYKRLTASVRLPETPHDVIKIPAVHLMTKIVCLMIVLNVHLENYVNYLIPTPIQNLNRF